MENIRSARLEDAPIIINLLEQLGYPNTESFLEEKLKMMLKHPNEEFFVYEVEGKVVAMMSMHIIPQIALEGDFARLSYFAVDANYRGEGVGKKMEKYAVKLAMDRKCDRIELHCNERRVESHKFYYRQGYEESPKYLMKKL